MRNTDEEDPSRVKLLAHDMDGNNMLAIDVVNGDILPSFKKDEIIDLQMIAFAESARFFADEEAYADTVEAGPNGKKTMIGTNTVFPIGMFSENENAKDVVQIHGIIKRAFFGISKFDEEEIKTSTCFIVETQVGDIEIVLPVEDFEEIRKNENMREGKVIDCFARLSGDALIYDYENGIIKDAEHNLKLVAYTFEDGDPERLRTVLSKDFIYHSENSGKHFENADEFIEFSQRVHAGKAIPHTHCATITGIADGTGELEYPVGTRCVVIGYEDEKGFNSIIFVDTDEEGNIKRIYLSRESRYQFKIDDPLPKKESLEDLLANTTYKSSIIGRAHFHSLVDDDIDEEKTNEFIASHQEELEADLADLFSKESSEEVFGEAFIRSVRKSSIPASEHREEDIISLGKQFYKDTTFLRTEEQQKEIYHDALVLVTTIGRLYKGRVKYTSEGTLDAEPQADKP